MKGQQSNKKGKVLPVRLPKTGIEQPFLRDRPRFKDTCKDFEPIHKFSTALCEEFEKLDSEKPLNGSTEKIVYDCIDYPTQRVDGDSTPYIDENDLVELPNDESANDNKKAFSYGPSG